MLTTRPGLIRKKILASVGEWRRKIIIESDIDEEDDQMREDEDDDDDGDKSLRKDRPSVKKTITDYGVEPHFLNLAIYRSHINYRDSVFE